MPSLLGAIGGIMGQSALTRRRNPDARQVDFYLREVVRLRTRQPPRHSQGRRPRGRDRLDRDSARERRSRALGLGHR
jgi:hypothetical protein